MVHLLAVLTILGTAVIALAVWAIDATIFSNVDGAMTTVVSQTNSPVVQQTYQNTQSIQNTADTVHDAYDFAKGPKIAVYFGVPATIIVGTAIAILRLR